MAMFQPHGAKKSETTPKNTIFAILLYLKHHNGPTIEDPVADIQLILEQLGNCTLLGINFTKDRGDSE